GGVIVLGSTVTFTIDVGNELGIVPAGTTITVTESVPAGTTLTSIGGSGWSCSPSPPVAGPATVTCTYVVPADLGEGGTVPTITVEIRVDSADVAIRNCAHVDGRQPTGAPLEEEADSNNDSCADVKVTRQPTTSTSTTTTTKTTTNKTTTNPNCQRT